MNDSSVTSPSRLFAWMQLTRLPNVFTAMADVVMGFMFTHATVNPLGVFALLLVSSSALYTAGMVLNDLCDFEQDLRERPHRPLPSGRVSTAAAAKLTRFLLVLGVFAGLVASQIAVDMRPAILAVALTAFVILYDRLLKLTALGPLAMGGCRALNVLLGMSVSPGAWETVHYLIAAGIGIYIAGVTWFARKEAATSRGGQLSAALLVMVVGMTALWLWPIVSDNAVERSVIFWTLLWIVVAGMICWRTVRAIVRPEPKRVQAAVKTCILAIVVLDAVTLAPVNCTASIGILLLLAPTILLGRWVYST